MHHVTDPLKQKPSCCPKCNTDNEAIYSYRCCESHAIGPTFLVNKLTFYWSCKLCAPKAYYEHYPSTNEDITFAASVIIP